MRILKRRRVVIVAATAAALILAGAGTAIAFATGHSGSTVAHVVVRTENVAQTYVGAGYTTIGSASLVAGAGSFIVATFSAESACYNGTGYCAVRILIDGLEAEPVAGTDFAFDSTDGGRETAASWEAHSMQRVRVVTTTTTHTITVQVAQVGVNVTARYDDWLLSGWAIAP